ncbi:hypothetical protein [Cedecea davisae]|uniref:hypothetical protein n=1 Tax=Cedecea davisae TaxID=158484 RepID=UPI003559270D
MPVVPTVQGRQVQSTGVQTGGFNPAPTQDAFGAIANVGEKYVGAFAEAKQRANVAMVQDASLQLSQRSNDLMTNPESGLLSLQGKNAIGKGQEYTSQFDAAASELAMQLPDDAARKAFMDQAQQQRIQFMTQAGRHEIGQINAYEEGQFQGVLTNNAKTASALYGDNGAYVSANQQTFQQIESYGAAHGWSTEQVQAKKIEFKEKVGNSALSQWAANDSLSLIQRNGELSDTASGSRRAISDDSSSDGARGIRNNNPGNLEYSKANPWVGQAGDDGRFAKFETPEHGIRALGRNLLSYQRQGIDTVNDIINRWAPAKDGNNTESYIKAVCDQLGVTADQQIDASNPDTLKALCSAIIHHENGSQPYSDQQLASGVSAAIGLSSLPTSTKRYTGNAAFDAASPEAQATFLRQADQVRKQQQAEYRSVISDRVRDANASYLRGVEYPNAPGQTDFINAYGLREGNQRYTDFRNMQIAGQYIGTFRTMPSNTIQQYVNSLQNQIGTGEGIAGRVEAFNHVQAAADQVLEQRRKDPQQAAVNIGLPFHPLDSSNALQRPGDWGRVLLERFDNSSVIAQKFGHMAGKNLLTPTESQDTNEYYQKLTADQRIQFWRNTQASSSPLVVSRLAKEIGGDAVQVSAVAALANTPTGYKTALAVENGSRLLNPVDGASKVRLPASFEQDISDAIKKQYPTLSPDQVQRLVPLVKDYHVGSGGSPDQTPKTDALHAVIGKPVNIYGSMAVAPAGGDENAFIDTLKTGVNRLGPDSQNVKNGLSQGVYGFVPDADGNQVLINASTQRRVVDNSGRPIVIGVNK